MSVVGRSFKAMERDDKSALDFTRESLREVQVELKAIKYFMKKIFSERKNLDPPTVPEDISTLDLAMFGEFDYESLEASMARKEEKKALLEEKMLVLLSEFSSTVYFSLSPNFD